jgi:hypothetical protein
MAVLTKQPPQQQAANGAPSKRLTLADTLRGGSGLPSRLVMYGEGGIGKTSFAAFAPKPLFLLSPGETGLHTLIDQGQLPEIPNLEVDWPNLLSVLEELRTAKHDYKTLVLDTIDGFEKSLKPIVIKTKFEGDDGPKGFTGYSAGDRYIAAVPWRELLMALDRLRSEKRMAIIALAHSTMMTFQNPSGPDYTRIVPDIYKDSWRLTFGWADLVLYGYRVVHASKDKGEKRAKASMGGRYMATECDAAFDAKNRHGLTGDIEMGDGPKDAWENFITAIREGRKETSNA